MVRTRTVSRVDVTDRGGAHGPDRRGFFDAIAADWDHRVVTNAFRTRLEAGVDALAIGAHEVVLDLGCGTGNLTALLAERAGSRGAVLAVDFSTAMLEIARAKLPRAPVWWPVPMRRRCPYRTVCWTA